jgi:hypothetical protein
LTPYSSNLSSLEQSSFSLDIWKFAAPHLKFILSRDLWSLTKWSFLDTCGKSFFSISHFLWTQPCCKLKQQHVGTSTFQHCQIFCIIFWSRDRTNKRLWNFYLSIYFGITSVQQPTSLSSNAGYRIHPYLVGRIIRHDAQADIFNQFFLRLTSILFNIFIWIQIN